MNFGRWGEGDKGKIEMIWSGKKSSELQQFKSKVIFDIFLQASPGFKSLSFWIVTSVWL